MTARLDPEAQALLDVMLAVDSPPPYALPLEEAREQMRAALISRGAPLPLDDVRDVAIPSAEGELGMRLYRPRTGKLPMALFIHGGGWTLNDLDTHDRFVRRVASRSGWLVASLDYRRAPEHRHPAALQDAQLAFRWLLDNAARLDGDAGCTAVVGESSGATTVAALTLLLRDLGAPQPSYQVLAYPLIDRPGRWPSHEERGEGYTLDRHLVRWYLDNYVPEGFDAGAWPERYLFPLTAGDLSGLPAALVMTAEFDPLRDEGAAYAQRLAAAGVEVEHVHVADQMHGFLLHDRAIVCASELIDRLADTLATRAQRS